MKQKKMPVFGHLQELRKRILLSFSVFVFASVVSLPVVPFLLRRVKEDLMAGVFLIVISPQEALMVELKASLLLGFVLSFPVLIHQFWSFTSPALMRGEKSIGLILLLSSTLLFIFGGLFAYFLLLPVTLSFLIDVSYSFALPMFSLNQAFSFVITLIVLFGIVFQLPLIVAVFSRLGLVDDKALRSQRRYVIVATFIIAALVTDPSVFTQILVAVPIVLLYEVSILISCIVGGRK